MPTTELPTFTPGAIDLLEFEELFDELLRCDARRDNSCSRPATWMCKCPVCSHATPYCDTCKALLMRMTFFLGEMVTAEHTGRGGCGKEFDMREIEWTPV